MVGSFTLRLRASVSPSALLRGATPLLLGVALAGTARAQVTISGSYTTTRNLDTLCGCTTPATATITSTGSVVVSAGNALLAGNQWTILNQGTLSGGSVNLSGGAIRIGSGTLTNAGT